MIQAYIRLLYRSNIDFIFGVDVRYFVMFIVFNGSGYLQHHQHKEHLGLCLSL